MVTRLLFVCLGNICRSPSAENIMNHLIEQRQLSGQIVCDSAGTASYHVGSAPDRRMNVAAQRQGITLTGSARQFVIADFEKFDLILAMDRSNYQDILALLPGDRAIADLSTRYADKVRLMCEFCRTHSDTEVPDPYYGGEAGFDYVIDLLRDACEGLLTTIAADLGA
ncbi:low molecular weight protein-tyrosine-phosphatase [soil metagenome]|uniref:low molecular weight protein-tyrosine-phosphatase n=1 Tax=Leptolyngbya sp. BC1307 TaxID=2029589 RepID=UPI000EFA89E3|nr:low molecular weight protein-tyrosine-phosphatase [Leptolyngbya sp. BC1307]